MPAILRLRNACPGLPSRSLRHTTGQTGKLRCFGVLFLPLILCLAARAQEPWTWEKVRARFEQSNPTLLADKLNIDESKAQEITAFLRPNPTFPLSTEVKHSAPDHRVGWP